MLCNERWALMLGMMHHAKVKGQSLKVLLSGPSSETNDGYQDSVTQ